MNYEKYLPIGTVVMLKGGKKRAMIIGFCAYQDEKKEKLYDYSACLYPEGMFMPDQLLLFDHEQIGEVFHLGLIDDEEKEFKKKLKEMIDSIQ